LKARVTGLLGGIGSGKTTAGKFFEKLGARLIDADKIAKKFLDKPKIKTMLVKYWGKDIVRGNRVDRKRLARKVFNNIKEVSKLNKLIHPYVKRELKRLIKRWRPSSKLVILDAPLIMEAGVHKLCDYLVFIHAPRRLRLQRLSKERGWSKQELIRRENAQFPVNKKRKASDFIINNTGSPLSLFKKVKKVYNKLI
jgi:dephospho-CoA kinase